MPEESRFALFRIGDETFLADVHSLAQIIPHTPCTRVPQGPDYLEGLLVLKDQPMPVVDLRARLFPWPPPPAKWPLVLVLESAWGRIGLKVDEVQRILSIDLEDILPPPELVRGIGGEFLIGIVPRGDDLYLLLDLDRILRDDEKRTLAEIAAAATTA